ncbi:MAG: PDZ domain-containing protein [bacterium]|nr:PDZ domain-containing protein [bacterium]
MKKRILIPMLGISILMLAGLGTILIQSAQAEPSKDAYLGVYLQETIIKTEQGEKKQDSGALVGDVVDNGPAKKAGIIEDDLITQFNGVKVDDSDHLRKLIAKCKPGDEATLVVMRSGAEKSLKVTMGEAPDKTVMIASSEGCGDCDSPNAKKCIKIMKGYGKPGAFLGVQLQPLSDQLAEYFKVKEGDGLLVSSVEKDSPAQKAGLKAGDVIVKVGDREVEDRSDLRKAFKDKKKGDEVEITAIRDGKEKKFKAQLDEMAKDCSSCSDCMSFGSRSDWGKGLEKIKELRMVAPDIDMEELGQSLKELRIQVEVPTEELKVQIEELKKELQELKTKLK